MFLLVPAHPGCPGQIPQSRKTVVCVCVDLCNGIVKEGCIPKEWKLSVVLPIDKGKVGDPMDCIEELEEFSRTLR